MKLERLQERNQSNELNLREPTFVGTKCYV